MSTNQEKKPVPTDTKESSSKVKSYANGKERIKDDDFKKDRKREVKKIRKKKRKENNRPTRKVAKVLDFTPSTKDMNNHVFQCPHESSDKNQYNRTVEELITYARKTFQYGADIAFVIKNEEFPDNAYPPSYAADASAAEKYIWEQDVKEAMLRRRTLENNLSSMYAVIYGQCSQAMKDELSSLDAFDEIDKHQDDCIELLQLIRGIMYKIQSRQHPFAALGEALRKFYTCRQSHDESVTEYKNKFDGIVKGIEYAGGSIGTEDALTEYVLFTTGQYNGKVNGINLGNPSSRAILQTAKKDAQERFLAMIFLRGADQKRFGSLLVALDNDYLHGQDKFPKTRVQAHTLLQHYRKADGKRAHGHTTKISTAVLTEQRDDTMSTSSVDDNIDRNFFMVDGGETNVDGMTQDKMDNIDFDATDVCCFQEHIEGLRTKLHAHISLLQSNRTGVPKTWVLLDSQSTVSIFKNKHMLVNIRKIPDGHAPLVLHTNGGILRTDMVGDLLGFGTVWYHPDSLANILSLAMVLDKCRVTMDTDVSQAMILHKPDGTTLRFERRGKGLFAYDASGKTKEPISDYAFVETVAENKTKFTAREVADAEKARKVLALIDRPSQAQFVKILQGHQLKNSPVEHMDAQRANYIFGPDVNSLKGKTVRRQPLHVKEFVPIPLPSSLLRFHKNIVLCADIFYVHKIPFLHTISRGIMFRTQQMMPDRHAWTVQQGLNTVINLYTARGFTVHCIHADNEFKCLENEFGDTTVNCCGEGEHVPEVERSIRTTKERTRCRTSSLPFRYYPKQLIAGIVNNAVKWLNAFPNDNAACKTLSPRAIVLGQDTDFNIDCRVELGTYCQITENNNPTNSQEPRSRDAIALHSTGNRQGTYFFLTLDTWEKVSRNQWTEIPMPDIVIQAVNQRGRLEGSAPIKRVNTFLFEWRPRIPIFPDDDHYFSEETDSDSDDSDDEYTSGDDDDDDDGSGYGTSSSSDRLSSAAEDDDSSDDSIYEDSDESDEELINDTLEEGEVQYINDTGVEEVPSTNNQNQSPSETAHDDYESYADDEDDADDEEHDASFEYEDHNHEEEEHSKDTAQRDNSKLSSDTDTTAESSNNSNDKQDDHKPDEEYEGHGYHTRQSQHKSKQHLFEEKDFIFMQVQEDPTPENKQRAVNAMVDLIFVQLGHDGVDMHKDMPMRKGLKVFGEKAVEAIIKEVSQFNELEAFEPLHADKITRLERKAALRALTFVKMKRCGRIKGRTVADGRPQRKIYSKDEAASPALAIESLLLSLAIDAIEKRDVATADIAGAYLKAHMDDFVLMKFEGEMVDYVVATNPELYEQYVTEERGRKVLYVRLNKALYGCMRSALLWYMMLAGYLKEEGFVVNPYDLCVANKVIDGKQFTICWYVDDLKLSHVDPKVVDKVIEGIESQFGKMNVVRGKEHVYVGCNLCFLESGDVAIDNIDYLKECIEAFGENVTQRVSSVATKHLFTVRKSEPLNEEKSALFHSIVMKLLWISKRSRPDLETALSFLCTRTSKSTRDDWFKLKRVLQFVNQTIDDKRIISADNLGTLSTWIDASYAVHEDMRSHTGAAISIGKGTVYCSSSKQKLNVKSSTEGEVVGASDKLPQSIWSKYFLEAQGYKVNDFDFYEDNQAAMRMLKNGRKSCGQKSRHINIRYFFITDRIQKESINIKYCPTSQMLADYFTKPLQGRLFHLMREVIMGIKPISALSVFETKECVGENVVPQTTENPEHKIPVKMDVTWSDVVRGIKPGTGSLTTNSPKKTAISEEKQSSKNKGLETLIVSRQSRTL